MKFRYPKLNEEFIISSGAINFIVVENPLLLDDLLMDFFMQMKGHDGNVSLIENDTKIDLAKRVCFIASPVEISFDDSLLKRKLYSKIEERIIDDGRQDEITRISTELADIIELIGVKEHIDIDVELSLQIKDILSGLKVAFVNPEGTFTERLIKFMEVNQSYLDKDVFIVIACEGYLDKNDYISIERFIKYAGIKFIMISSAQTVMDMEGNTVIIDKDLCVI